MAGSTSVRGVALAGSILALAGCATSSVDQGFDGVARIVTDRTAQQVVCNHGSTADRKAVDSVSALLSKPLGPDDAVQVALFRNRGLQAGYAELGLAQADLVQAGLLQNPALGVNIRFPDRLYSATDVGLDLTQNVLNLILLPAKRDVAQAQLAVAQARAAASVLDLVADVRKAWFRLAADQAIAGVLRDRAAASDAAASLTRRLHDAGNISDLDLARQQADAELTRTEYADALAAGMADREELNRLLGLFGPETAWTLSDTLPDLPPDRLPYDRLETMAITGNLRIAALRNQAEASARALGIARNYGWLTDVQFGVSTEKNPEGYRVTGRPSRSRSHCSTAGRRPAFGQPQPCSRTRTGWPSSRSTRGRRSARYETNSPACGTWWTAIRQSSCRFSGASWLSAFSSTISCCSGHSTCCGSSRTRSRRRAG